MPVDPAIYYQGVYWNDYPLVAAEINRRISGDAAQGYVDYFHELVGRRRFARALFVNCGNGWVDRALLDAGIIESGVGIDLSGELLATARCAAAGLPLHYVRTDANAGTFPHERYDLIVNYAAAHHVSHIDRFFRALCRSLTPDGCIVNYDYVGPHRNQYPYDQWERVWRINHGLPANARQVLAYPHLPTMLATDPTEAIHSELLLSTYERYFSLEDYRAVGGAIAYPLLIFNAALESLPETEARPIVEKLLLEDKRYLEAHPESTLFAFWWGRPHRRTLADHELLHRWDTDEREREAAAVAAGGRYYPASLLETLMTALGRAGSAL